MGSERSGVAPAAWRSPSSPGHFRLGQGREREGETHGTRGGVWVPVSTKSVRRDAGALWIESHSARSAKTGGR